MGIGRGCAAIPYRRCASRVACSRSASVAPPMNSLDTSSAPAGHADRRAVGSPVPSAGGSSPPPTSTASCSRAPRSRPSVDVVAVGSRDLGRAQAFAAQHGIPAAYGSYEELLADPSVEAIYNPLPNTMHCEWSIRALEAGKHVLCEKPMSSSPAEVEGAFAAAERTGFLLTEAFMYRHHPQTKRLAELVAEGAIGDLRLIRSVSATGSSTSRTSA